VLSFYGCPKAGFVPPSCLKMQNKNILVKKIGKKGGKFFLGHISKYPFISVVLGYISFFTI